VNSYNELQLLNTEFSNRKGPLQKLNVDYPKPNFRLLLIWFRRRMLPFTYVCRYALAWLVQKEDVTIYICFSACTGMVGSEGGCYYLHMFFGMHWHG
jgi:hypothetical protein